VRIGILGGVFNPPHVGHLVCAQEAYEQLGLDTVLFVPVGEAPHRAIEDDPGRAARAELCERAVAGDDRFSLSRIEVDRAGPSYTVETLRALEAKSPGDSLILILGADQARTLPGWHEPEEVLRRALVAVAARDGTSREEVRRAVAGLSGADRLGFFDMQRIDVSSTSVRERARRGRSLRYLVPDPVARLIEDRGLYRASAKVAAD
jgi:nicotinate-nucleotide adenylyltransferase